MALLRIFSTEGDEYQGVKGCDDLVEMLMHSGSEVTLVMAALLKNSKFLEKLML